MSEENYLWIFFFTGICVLLCLLIELFRCGARFLREDSYERPTWDRTVTFNRSNWRTHPKCFFRFHHLHVVRDTGVQLYRECPTCRERCVVHYANAWKPIDTQWLLTGQFCPNSSRDIVVRLRQRPGSPSAH